MRQGINANRNFAEANRNSGAALSTLTGQLSGLVGGLVGAGGVVAAYDEWIQRIEIASERQKELGTATRQATEDRLNLAALRGVETPEQVAELDRLAVFAGRHQGEAARLATLVQSVLPASTFTDQQRRELLIESATIGQSNTASLPAIAGGLTPLVLSGATARQAGNLFQAAVTEAGEPDPAKLAEVIGEFLAVGQEVGGLDRGEATGFAAAVTGLGIKRDIAKTGLKNLILGIRAPQGDEAEAALASLGIDASTPIEEALRRISSGVQSGAINQTDIINIAGREGVAVALKLAGPQTLDQFFSRVGNVDAAEDLGGSASVAKNTGIFQPGSFQALNLQAKQAEVETGSIEAGNSIAARAAAGRAELQKRLAELEARGELSPSEAKVILDEYDVQIGFGRSVEEAVRQAERTPRVESLLIRRDPISGERFQLFGGPQKQDIDQLFDEIAEKRDGIPRRSDFIEGPVIEALESGPSIDPSTFDSADGVSAGTGTVINNDNRTIINNTGTQIYQANDPLEAGLDFTEEDDD